MIIMMLVKKMKMLLLKTEMHNNIGALDIVNDKLGLSLSKPLDDTVRTWSIHSRTVINKATRRAGIKL